MRPRGSVLLAAAAALLGCAVLLILLGGLCPARTLLGIPCPGCGMSRAVCAVLSLDFSAAFAYHPLWPLLPLVAILLFRAILPRAARSCLHTLRVSEAAYLRAEAILCALLLVAFLAVWVLRLCTGWRG